MAPDKFDRDMAHAVVTRAIDQLKDGGVKLSRRERDHLYRMGMIGIMALFAACGRQVPKDVREAVAKGTPISSKHWHETLGRPQ